MLLLLLIQALRPMARFGVKGNVVHWGVEVLFRHRLMLLPGDPQAWAAAGPTPEEPCGPDTPQQRSRDMPPVPTGPPGTAAGGGEDVRVQSRLLLSRNVGDVPLEKFLFSPACPV